jgi:urease alpha subunit
MRLTQEKYVARYGPGTRDRIRLADTGRWVHGLVASHAVPGRVGSCAGKAPGGFLARWGY